MVSHTQVSIPIQFMKLCRRIHVVVVVVVELFSLDNVHTWDIWPMRISQG